MHNTFRQVLQLFVKFTVPLIAFYLPSHPSLLLSARLNPSFLQLGSRWQGIHPEVLSFCQGKKNLIAHKNVYLMKSTIYCLDLQVFGSARQGSGKEVSSRLMELYAVNTWLLQNDARFVKVNLGRLRSER